MTESLLTVSATLHHSFPLPALGTFLKEITAWYFLQCCHFTVAVTLSKSKERKPRCKLLLRAAQPPGGPLNNALLLLLTGFVYCLLVYCSTRNTSTDDIEYDGWLRLNTIYRSDS